MNARSLASSLLALCIGCGGGNLNNNPGVRDLAMPASANPDLAGGGDDAATMGGDDLAIAASTDMAMLPPPGSCDPFMQSGCPGTLKCTEIQDPMMNLVSDCKPLTGMLGPDAPCVRANMVIGDDNCKAGLFCSGIGSINPTTPNRHCRAFCRGDADCKTSGQKCTDLDGQGTGICVPLCTPFGKDCPNGYSCTQNSIDIDQNNVLTTCSAPGKIAIGAACMVTSDCPLNASCFDPTGGMKAVCVAQCDAMHPCAKGTCKPVAMGPMNLSYCQ